jgi:hypothetical protein
MASRRWCGVSLRGRRRAEAEQAATRACMAEYWEERRKLFVEPRAIDARLLEIGTVVTDTLPDADLMTEVYHRFVD